MGELAALRFPALLRRGEGALWIGKSARGPYAGRLRESRSDHPQANRLGSLLTIGHVNSDALGLC